MATRPAVRMRVTGVSSTLGLPSPVYVSRVEHALESGADRGVLFIDLASCAAEPTLVPLLQTWDAFRPGTEIVLFTPLVDRDCELRAVAAICCLVRSAEVRVMTASDFYRDDVWRNLADMREGAALEAEFRAEFLSAVRRTGRPLRGEPGVLIILHDAPRIDRAIRATSETRLVDLRAPETETERKALWKLLRRSGQMPASWLLLVFRLLWYAKLRELGWGAARVARFLGYDSPRGLRRTIQRRFGVGLRELKAVRYADALTWAAELVTSSHVRLAQQPVRALIAPLLADAGPSLGTTAAMPRRASREA